MYYGFGHEGIHIPVFLIDCVFNSLIIIIMSCSCGARALWKICRFQNLLASCRSDQDGSFSTSKAGKNLSVISVIWNSDQELKGRRECQIIEDACGVCTRTQSHFKEHLEVKLKRITLDNMIKCRDQIKGASAAGIYSAGSAAEVHPL